MFSRSLQTPTERAAEMLRLLPPGFYHDFDLEADDGIICCNVFIPSQIRMDHNGRRYGFFGFDGYTFGQYGLPIINRVNDTAEKYGLLAIYPKARSRLFGKVHNIWSAKHALAPYHPWLNHPDDILAVKRLKSIAALGLNVDCNVAIGFSAGAQFSHLLATEGLVDAVVSVSGTWVPGQPLPKPGVRIIAFIGGSDPLLPADRRGVYGRVQERVLSFLLMRFSARWYSNPLLQLVSYRVANKLSSIDVVVQKETHYTRTEWGKGLAVVYFLPESGHVWNGRHVRVGFDSQYSHLRGKVLPANQFNTNEFFAHDLGWDKLVLEAPSAA
jgi:hypothetical protein